MGERLVRKVEVIWDGFCSVCCDVVTSNAVRHPKTTPEEYMSEDFIRRVWKDIQEIEERNLHSHPHHQKVLSRQITIWSETVSD